MRLRQLKKASIKTDFEKLTRNMPKSAKIFTRMQFMEGHKKKKGHRFILDEKILSLSLYKKSPKAYSLMSKYFTLPSRKVLKTLLAQVKMQPGINPIIFNELKTTISKMQPQDRLCTLIFDEMSIYPQIFYNPYTDDLVGFENFGKEKTKHFANHALVFMVKGVKKNFKQPVAYYFTQRLSTPRLKEILKEVAAEVLATGLKIVATVCDQGSPNTSCVNNLILEAKTSYFSEGKEWKNDVILINDQEIIPLFDVPHLIKGIRNNLLNKDVIYSDKNGTKNVKWEYFQQIFAADKAHGELRLLPKITREHVDPTKIKKMRVKHAVQVLSHSMAVATDNLVARGDLPQECANVIPFLILIDKLFDSLNASSFSVPHGKKYRAAVKRNSPHHELWQEALKLLKSIKFIFIRGDGSKIVKNVPTVNNFIKTIEGFKSLWQLLSKKHCLDSMLTRNFNQDPLENFFGSIRSLGARNVAPNCMGFEGAFKTLLLNNISSDHSVHSNCEKDSNECLQSLSFFIKHKDKGNAPSQPQDIIIDQPLDAMQSTVADSGDDQRTYVCGWALTKCLQKVSKGCKQCKNKLLGDSNNAKYRFIRTKEYEKDREWLTYPSDCLVACFHDIQNTTIAFLNSECFKKNIKERIIAFIDLFVDFSFMNCESHKDKLKDCFLNTTVNIIIYSWCRTVNRILDGKINYEGDDIVKKAAQVYHNTHKSIKK